MRVSKQYVERCLFQLVIWTQAQSESGTADFFKTSSPGKIIVLWCKIQNEPHHLEMTFVHTVLWTTVLRQHICFLVKYPLFHHGPVQTHKLKVRETWCGLILKRFTTCLFTYNQNQHLSVTFSNQKTDRTLDVRCSLVLTDPLLIINTVLHSFQKYVAAAHNQPEIMFHTKHMWSWVVQKHNFSGAGLNWSKWKGKLGLYFTFFFYIFCSEFLVAITETLISLSWKEIG